MRPPPLVGTLAAMNLQSHHRRARAVIAITATTGLALLATACSTGSGGSPTAGGSASSSPAVSTGSGGSTGLLAYASCMRSHGVPDFPDPASSGGIPKQGVISAENGVSNSQVDAAQNACSHLLPPGGSLSGQPIQTITTQQQQDYLKAVACMRSHGITNFPDPVFQNGQVEFPNLEHDVDTKSTQFTQADQICKKLIPPGLPGNESGSGSGG
jgi:hypothetical protein